MSTLINPQVNIPISSQVNMPINTAVVLASQSPRRKQLLEQIGLTAHVIKVDVPEEYNNETAVDYVKRLACDKARAGCDAYGAYCAKNLDSNPTDSSGLSDLLTSSSSAPNQPTLNLPVNLPVIGADTVVVHNGRVLEKPVNQLDAQAMLLALSGESHEVITAVAVSHNGALECISVSTQVSFREISPEEALHYWQTGEPQDKAGGYGIQGLGAVFVENITGSYSNVVGLPLFETAELLARLGVKSF